MDGARLAIGALATLGSGIALGLAANPTLRTFPEADWRARYRAMATAPQGDPVPQPGVSYYGDGSTAWAWGGVPVRRYHDDLPPLRIPVWHEPDPEPAPAVEQDPVADPAMDENAAERAAAQAIVADALVRSAARASQQDAAASEPPEAPSGRAPDSLAQAAGPTMQ